MILFTLHLMKKTILFILVVLSIVVLLTRYSGKFSEILFNIKPKSGISVLSLPSEAKVSLDGTEVGSTPYENQTLEPKEYLVKIEKDGVSWEGKVKLGAETLTVINRELSTDGAFGAGEILSLEKGKGLTIVANPSDSQIEIDGKSYGSSPASLDIPPGDHTISLSHGNYQKRNIMAKVPDNFNLKIVADLSLSEADLTTISTPPIKTTAQVKVLDTPTGFLRVRDKPSVSGKEVGRVKPGDTLVLLEEISGWDRVRLTDNTEGYVSSSYVEKQNP